METKQHAMTEPDEKLEKIYTYFCSFFPQFQVCCFNFILKVLDDHGVAGQQNFSYWIESPGYFSTICNTLYHFEIEILFPSSKKSNWNGLTKLCDGRRCCLSWHSLPTELNSLVIFDVILFM
jgi:hypothetical protein